MPYVTLLGDAPRLRGQDPSCFGDLGLGRLLDAVTGDDTASRAVYRTPLDSAVGVRYRQDVFRDLEDDAVRDALAGFVESMQTLTRRLAFIDGLRPPDERSAWGLKAITTYGDAVHDLHRGLADLHPASRGLARLVDALGEYTSSDAFTGLVQRARDLTDELSRVRYNLLLRGAKITVGAFDDEPDYAAEMLDLVDRFRRDEHRHDRRAREHPTGAMDHVEAAVLAMVADLNSGLFDRVARFWEASRDFVDPTLRTVERDLGFYLSWHAFLRRLHDAGLPTCYPDVVEDHVGVVRARSTYDVALAETLLPEGAVVTNDVDLAAEERLLVVSGPNQGGKTTLARTLGQLHHLAAVGCPVAGKEVRLRLTDRVLTHFERAEDVTTLTGKLEDELVRVRDVLEVATPDSLVVLNEMFASTTAQDALDLGREVLRRLRDLGPRTVCVTFLDELARFDEHTVSMVAGVDEHDPARRTYRLTRRPADGRAYARAVAEKYRLGYHTLLGRLAS